MLPTIQDNHKYGDVANKRKEIQVSLKERTETTQRFNEKLFEASKLNGYVFLDFSKVILDENTSEVNVQFLNPNPLDHHLDSKKIAPLLNKELLKIL